MGITGLFPSIFYSCLFFSCFKCFCFFVVSLFYSLVVEEDYINHELISGGSHHDNLNPPVLLTLVKMFQKNMDSWFKYFINILLKYLDHSNKTGLGHIYIFYVSDHRDL